MMGKKTLTYLFSLAAVLLMASCSVYKYVPEGEYLLHKVDVSTVGESDLGSISHYRNMSYQVPNTKWLGLLRIPLRVYSMSGKYSDDPSREGLFRKIGEQPVILDTMLCSNSMENMKRSLTNAGYLKADVKSEIRYFRKPKADVSYLLDPGPCYVVRNYRTEINDSEIDSLITASERLNPSLIHEGMKFDASVLENERERIASFLQTRGYYNLGKDVFYFVADTVAGSTDVSLTMYLRPRLQGRTGGDDRYHVYTIDSVSYILGGKGADTGDLSGFQRTQYGTESYYSIPGKDGSFRLKPRIIRNHSFLTSGRLYDSRAVSRTYTSMANLDLVKYSNIRFTESIPDSTLNAFVYISPYPKYSFAAELEGTNTAGDLGVAAQASITNRNLFGGGERLSLILRGAFEAITDLPGYTGNSYIEYGAEANLKFPKFVFPFLKSEFQRRSQATTELSFMLNSQNRPEFRKTVLSFSWSYLWRMRRHSHRIDLPDVNFLTVPWVSDVFRKEYLDPIDSRNSILRYNYEDMLLSRFGYTFSYTNAGGLLTGKPLTLSLRISAETSGNLLNGISNLTNADSNESGQYKCFGVAFAQYVRSDGEFTLNWKVDKWNNLLFHAEYGVAYPYSNSASVPFEKRFYAGGANSVRGWSVRELGPGMYRGELNAVNYVKQAGDIKLGASVELRSHLFWKINMALFVDAGNIWTIREYEEQPGGVFRIGEFYKQLGVSCGAGIRLDLNFLVFRVDYGKQILNPAYDRSSPEHFPFVHSVDYRDYAFHFAIGYPF